MSDRTAYLIGVVCTGLLWLDFAAYGNQAVGAAAGLLTLVAAVLRVRV